MDKEIKPIPVYLTLVRRFAESQLGLTSEIWSGPKQGKGSGWKDRVAVRRSVMERMYEMGVPATKIAVACGYTEAGARRSLKLEKRDRPALSSVEGAG